MNVTLLDPEALRLVRLHDRVGVSRFGQAPALTLPDEDVERADAMRVALAGLDASNHLLDGFRR